MRVRPLSFVINTIDLHIIRAYNMSTKMSTILSTERGAL